MKLDGNKLIADLETVIKQLNYKALSMYEASETPSSINDIYKKTEEVETLIQLIKSGDYTIKDKTERTTNYKPTVQEVKNLREKSAFGMKACKEALRVCNGIEEDAHEYLILKYSI